MIITSPLHNLLDSTDHLVNWTNLQKRCVEPVERQFKTFYPKNYLNYISSDYTKYNFYGEKETIGTVFYDPDDLIYHNKYIFNVYLYEHPKQQLTVYQIKNVLNNLFRLVLDLDIKAISLPIFESYNSGVPSSEIISLIEEMVIKLIPDRIVTIYV